MNRARVPSNLRKRPPESEEAIAAPDFGPPSGLVGYQGFQPTAPILVTKGTLRGQRRQGGTKFVQL